MGKITQEGWQTVDGDYIYCVPNEMILEKIQSLL
jgi:hypothetical protein